jgi:hypothetical protein
VQRWESLGKSYSQGGHDRHLVSGLETCNNSNYFNKEGEIGHTGYDNDQTEFAQKLMYSRLSSSSALASEFIETLLASRVYSTMFHALKDVGLVGCPFICPGSSVTGQS